uniref:Uncharacterized protein n=1 Tax=Zonotrichia albicollis TaxID=44394 RepID=A0A8D2MP37_ZONAL
MRDVRISAHFCPFLSRGVISCFVIRLMNHSWRVESRLVIHRLSRDGSSRAGNVIEMRISGIPRKDGLENWSKKSFSQHLQDIHDFGAFCYGLFLHQVIKLCLIIPFSPELLHGYRRDRMK